MYLLKLLHLLAVVLWVGGMFFAYTALRPAAVEVLQPPERLRLWDGVFRRFLRWVWVAVILLLTTGMVLINWYGGVYNSPHFVQAMLILGTLMVLFFVIVYFAGYRRLHKLVAEEQWPAAGMVLGKMRQLIGINLALGITTICVVGFGRAGFF